jgi:hypothetical protein
MTNVQFENYVKTYGSPNCIDCGDLFTVVTPCCCDDGNLETEELGGLEWHVNGRCEVCCKRSKHNGRMDHCGIEPGRGNF